MRVIGTAGHVDHGKSTLVQALTGINPDRLAEEQAREMTIDLGFAWIQLPDGETVGIVDVPGHEDFIENMLAGVGGIDAAMLIIAADEGVMPQTHEHLAILDLLEIPRIFVALTKIDMVDDDEWLELVALDIQDTLATTRFEDAVIVPVSAHTGEGLENIVDTLATILSDVPDRTPDGIPRLPVDRVFTLSGFGTVVTGTLLDGPLSVGETVEIQPTGKQARIRGLQSHNKPVETAVSGSRVAVNLSGIEKQDVQRGYVLTQAGLIHPTQLMDVALTHLAEAPRPLKHNTEVKVFVGTAEVLARVRLLMDDLLLPGVEGWAQLALYDPLPTIRGQRFIIRIPSPSATIGGGLILDTAPGRKWKRRRPEVAARFERLVRGTPSDLVSESLIQARRPMQIRDVLARTQLASLDTVQDDPALIWYDNWLIHREVFSHFQDSVQRILSRYHEEYPLQAGMFANTLRNRLHLESDSFDVLTSLLIEYGSLAVFKGLRLHLPTFSVRYTRNQQEAVEHIRTMFEKNPYTPPSVKETIAKIGEPLLEALISQGTLVRLSTDVLVSIEVYREWIEYARAQLDAGNPLKVSSFRDTFNTSRKYALAFLEHLESRQLTRRIADEHIAGTGDWSQVLD